MIIVLGVEEVRRGHPYWLSGNGTIRVQTFSGDLTSDALGRTSMALTVTVPAKIMACFPLKEGILLS